MPVLGLQGRLPLHGKMGTSREMPDSRELLPHRISTTPLPTSAVADCRKDWTGHAPGGLGNFARWVTLRGCVQMSALIGTTTQTLGEA